MEDGATPGGRPTVGPICRPTVRPTHRVVAPLLGRWGRGPASDWSWLARATQQVAAADTVGALRQNVLAAVSELVPSAPVGLAELANGSFTWTATAGPVPQAALAAVDAVVGQGAGPRPAPVRRPDGPPVVAVGLHGCNRFVGALVVVGHLDDDAASSVDALAAVVGPKLGRFQHTARTEAILAHASEVFTICQTDGTITYQSPSASRVFGVLPEATVGRNVVDLVPEDHVATVLQALRMPPGGRSTAIAGWWQDEDGNTRLTETTAANLADEPAVGGVLLTTRDVTERRALEAELAHAQRLEAVGRLAAGIAHEVNTPVQFIGDNLHFLVDAFEALVAAAHDEADGVAAADDELAFIRREVPLALAQALEGVERVARIGRAMKALGHPDDGHPCQVDLNRVLVDACTVAHNAIKHVAEVEQDLGDLPPVRCQAGDIGQVFLNLLVNAADAVAEAVAGTGTRGRITLRSRRSGSAVVVTVADTGTGIAPMVADHVFEPFFTTKEIGQGTGQGLALARAVVDHHGGSIRFDTGAGGTTFTVTLPIDGPPGSAG